jgi:TonB family protein
MVKPLRSDEPNPPSVQFKDFGVLNDGSQSKGAFTTSIVTNLLIAALVIIVGSVVKNTVAPPPKKDLTFAEIPKEPPPPPPPPPKLPPPPKIEPPKVEPPKIKLPEPIPEPVKLPEVKMAPTTVKLPPAPPKAVTPPPAPVAIRLAPPTPASVPNHDANPSPVRLGNPTNPLKPMTGPAVSNVNLGVAGHPNMPAGNTGSGAPSKVSIAGSGSPSSQNMAGRSPGAVTIAGLKNGVPGGTGKVANNSPSAVAINTQAVAPTQITPQVHAIAAGSPPKLIYKPQPVYTSEARTAHIEGAVSIRIRVTAAGAVQVVGVTHGLGHGLDQSALTVAQGMRFQPATDASGHPVDWEGVVNVNFQIAG